MIDALIKAGRPAVMRTGVLRWPIVFLRVRNGMCVRCSTLILLIKTVCCSIPHRNIEEMRKKQKKIKKSKVKTAPKLQVHKVRK